MNSIFALYLVLFTLNSSAQPFVPSLTEETAYGVSDLGGLVLEKKRLTKILIQEATKLKGTKYKYGGSTTSGMDCSGLIHHLYEKVSIHLPRSTSLQVAKGTKVRAKDLQTGDLIFFKHKKKVSHVAMVIHNRNNQLVIVHSTSSKGVIFEDLNSSAYWKNKIFVAKRLI